MITFFDVIQNNLTISAGNLVYFVSSKLHVNFENGYNINIPFRQLHNRFRSLFLKLKKMSII